LLRLVVGAGEVARVEATGKIVGGQNITALGSIHSFNLITSGTNEAQLGSATLSVGTRAAGNLGAVIRGAASQSADYLQVQNSAGSSLWRVNNNGVPISSNVWTSFVQGVAGGGGAYIRLTGNETIMTGDVATTVKSIVRGSTGQVEDLSEWQSWDGTNATVLGGRNANAQIFTGSTAPIQTAVGAGINGVSGNGTTVTFSTTNAHGLANGDRVTIAGLTPAGYNGTYIISGVSTFSFNIANTTTGTATGSGTVSVDAQTSITARSAGTVGAVIRGATSQSSDLLQIQNSSQTVLASFGSSGLLNIANASIRVNTQNQSYGARIQLNTEGTGVIGQVIRATASQTADLLQIQTSGGSNIFNVDASGMTNATRLNLRGAVYGTGAYFGSLNVLQEPGGNAAVLQGRDTQSVDMLRIRQGATSTGDFITMQNSGGTNMARITSAGLVRAADNVIANALVGASGSADNSVTTSLVRIQANSTLGGGWLQATRLTSAPGSITADSGQVYFRTGTNPNTLKLVVKAGAGAEQTIIDNIPTT
jgi:hypothetical protein